MPSPLARIASDHENSQGLNAFPGNWANRSTVRVAEQSDSRMQLQVNAAVMEEPQRRAQIGDNTQHEQNCQNAASPRRLLLPVTNR